VRPWPDGWSSATSSWVRSRCSSSATPTTCGYARPAWSGFALGIWAGIHAIGVAIGLLVLVAATGLPLWAGSLVVMAVEVALTPLGGIALTLLYGDAAVEHDEPDAAGEAQSEPSPVSAGPSPVAP
jgi:hypothetical protein